MRTAALFQSNGTDTEVRHHSLTLKSILRVWLFHWRFTVLTIVFGVFIAFIILVFQHKLYSSYALVGFSRPEHHYLRTGNRFARTEVVNSVIETSLVFVSSNAFLRKLAERAGLFEDPEFFSSDKVSSDSKESIVLEALAERMSVSRRGGSHILSFEITSRRPEKSATIANIAAELFVEHESEKQRQAQDAAIDWLNRAINNTRFDLTNLENQIAEITSRNQLSYDGQKYTTSEMNNAQHVELARRLASLKADGSEIKARLQQLISIEEKRQKGRSSFAEDPILEPLLNLEIVLQARLAELRVDLGERHPKLIGLKNNLDITRLQIAEIELGAKRRLKNELLINQARQEEIDAQIMQINEISDVRKMALQKLSLLGDRVKTNERYLTKLSEIVYNIERDKVRGVRKIEIVSSASIPTKHSFPVVLFPLAYAASAAFVFSLVAIFLYDRWVSDFGFKSLLDVRDAELEPLGIIPELSTSDAEGKQFESYVLAHPHSAQAEAYQRIRSRLCTLRAGVVDDATVVLVTSSSPTEGKTSTAIALARQMVRSGSRILLIDADVRNPQVAACLGLEQKPGLCEILSSTSLQDVKIYRDPFTDLDIMLSGKSDLSVADLLRSSHMDYLVRVLRQHYDWIFFDSPALGAVTDGLVLAKHADMTVYVVHWLKTRPCVVKNNISQLLEIDGNSVAVTLTRVDPNAWDKYENLEEIKHYGYYDTVQSMQNRWTAC